MIRFTLFSVLLIGPLLLSASQDTASSSLATTRKALTKTQNQRILLLQKLIESQQWKELGKQVKIGVHSKEITLRELDHLAQRYPQTPFAIALSGTKKILSLHEKTGLSLEITFPIALFAETMLSQEIAKGTHFWKESLFGRELQYDYETNRFFIHLGTKGVKPIGEGRKKIVTKTVLYDRDHPEVMARAVTTHDIYFEMFVMNKIREKPGVLRAEALMSHTDPASKKRIMTIVTHLYRPGSLQSVIKNRSLKLTLKEQLKIASDILTGIASLQKLYYIHRDLGARNYLVSIKGTKPGQRRISAVVAAFGRTVPLIYGYNVPVQGNCCYLSPEGFFPSKMVACDYSRSDLFAVGCVLWQLYYGDMPVFGKKRLYKETKIPLQTRYEKHLALVKATRAKPLKYLQQKIKNQTPLTVRDRFLAMILKMIDPDPHQRGTGEELQKEALSLYNEAK